MNKNRLDEMKRNGKKELKNIKNVESPGAKGRKVDASQAFTVRIAKFDDDPVKDAVKKMKLLGTVEKELQGEHGIRRYQETAILEKTYNC